MKLFYNEVHIFTFQTGIDGPPFCLPRNQIDFMHDKIKFKTSENVR